MQECKHFVIYCRRMFRMFSFAVTPARDLCQSGPSATLSSRSLILSSHDIAHSHCPSTIRGLQLRASPGQQVNVTLVDFMWGAATERRPCTPYGHIVDMQTGRKVALCGGQSRESTVLLSLSSAVKMDLMPVDPDVRFLLKFQGPFNILHISVISLSVFT